MGESLGRDLVDLSLELGDLGLSKVQLPEWLNDVPLLGILAKTARVAAGVQEQVFRYMACRFLKQLATAEVPDQTKQALANMAPEPQRRMSHAIIEELTALDDQRKSDLLAHFFLVCVSEQFNLDEFKRFALAIRTCLLSDLIALFGSAPEIDKVGTFEFASEAATRLASAGLIEQARGMPPTTGPRGLGFFRYRFTVLGVRFCELQVGEFARGLM